MFLLLPLSSLSFIFLFLPCPPLSFPLLSLLSLFTLSLGDNTKWLTRVDVSLNLNTICQSSMSLTSLLFLDTCPVSLTHLLCLDTSSLTSLSFLDYTSPVSLTHLLCLDTVVPCPHSLTHVQSLTHLLRLDFSSMSLTNLLFLDTCPVSLTHLPCLDFVVPYPWPTFCFLTHVQCRFTIYCALTL